MSTIIKRFTHTILICTLLIVFGCTGCTPDSKGGGAATATPPPAVNVNIPKFDKMSAFNFIQKQVDFGPRVMNSEGHEKCKNWMVETFKSYGAVVIEQDFKAKVYTGLEVDGTNIIAQFNPEHTRRVVLAAHWDTRHIADHDPDPANHDTPILGADDGGSGVGVLLEIARVIKENPIDLGVDIVLFDAEDYGNDGEGDNTLTWCLGSQHWSKNLHRSDYKPMYGILLDMVGSKGARFLREETSMHFAPNLMKKVWKLGGAMGYSQFFIDQTVRGVTDDHYFVNDIAKIKMIDIINKQPDTKSGFGHYWHTQKDNMEVIDTKTLRAVGQVTLAVLYKESGGMF